MEDFSINRIEKKTVPSSDQVIYNSGDHAGMATALGWRRWALCGAISTMERDRLANKELLLSMMYIYSAVKCQGEAAAAKSHSP